VLALSYEKLVVNRGELRERYLSLAVGADITVTVRSPVASFLRATPPCLLSLSLPPSLSLSLSLSLSVLDVSPLLRHDSRNCTFVHVSPLISFSTRERRERRNGYPVSRYYARESNGRKFSSSELNRSSQTAQTSIGAIGEGSWSSFVSRAERNRAVEIIVPRDTWWRKCVHLCARKGL